MMWYAVRSDIQEGIEYQDSTNRPQTQEEIDAAAESLKMLFKSNFQVIEKKKQDNESD